MSLCTEKERAGRSCRELEMEHQAPAMWLWM